MKAILLIGGFGTRLRPLTLTKPKALLPVLNRPFLSYQLDLLKEGGVTDVMMACGKHSVRWKNAYKSLTPSGMKMHFAFEPKPLGTGGAIRFAYDALQRVAKKDSDPYLIFNGDVFFNLSIREFLKFHSKNRSHATLALTRVEDPSRFGVVKIERGNQITRFLEKPKPPFPSDLINAGAYLLDKRAIETIPKGRVVSVEREVFPGFLRDGSRLFGFPMKGYWNDIGTHKSYLQAHKDLLLDNNRWTGTLFLRKRGRLRFAPPHHGRLFSGKRVSVGKNTTFDGFVSLGNKVLIGKNCRISNSVILDGCRIDEGAQISGATIGHGCRVGTQAWVREGSVLADGMVVPPYTRC